MRGYEKERGHSNGSRLDNMAVGYWIRVISRIHRDIQIATVDSDLNYFKGFPVGNIVEPLLPP
jgi:hypothetical protein